MCTWCKKPGFGAKSPKSLFLFPLFSSLILPLLSYPLLYFNMSLPSSHFPLFFLIFHPCIYVCVCVCVYIYISRLLCSKSSVQFSRSIMSYSATSWTEACQASLSITNSWSLLKVMSIELVMPSAISTSVVPVSSCPQTFLASGPFQMSQLFASGGQIIGVLASTSVLPMNNQD